MSQKFIETTSLLDRVAADEDSKKKEQARKQEVIRNHQIDTKYDEINRIKTDSIGLANIQINNLTPDQIQSLKAANTEYFMSAKSAPTFLMSEFRYLVIPASKNIILVAAPSGAGKSNVCANVIYSYITQGKKVLVISNEEQASDVFNRVTCLMKGWAYTRHSSFTDEQVKTLNEYYETLAPHLTVIDNNMAQTASVDGMETILNNLIETKQSFDLIVIDYYQNVDHSVRNPKLDINDSQSRFVKFLDRFKNKYPAPILLLAQIAKETKRDQRFYKERIEGRKIVTNVATIVIELVTDHEECRTDWIFHKSRFSKAGVRISTGWDRGLYVPYTDQFKADVDARKSGLAKKENENE